jgi:hypothetical protein
MVDASSCASDDARRHAPSRVSAKSLAENVRVGARFSTKASTCGRTGLHHVRCEALPVRFVCMKKREAGIEPARNQCNTRLHLKQRVEVVEDRVVRIGGTVRRKRQWRAPHAERAPMIGYAIAPCKLHRYIGPRIPVRFGRFGLSDQRHVDGLARSTLQAIRAGRRPHPKNASRLKQLSLASSSEDQRVPHASLH